MGNQIRDIVKNSINSGDYIKMSQDVGSTVNSALESAFEEVKKAINTIQVESQYNKNKTTQAQSQPKPTINPTQQNQQTSNTSAVNKSMINPSMVSQQAGNLKSQSGVVQNHQGIIKQQTGTSVYFPHYPVGKVAGNLQTVFGSIGIGVLGAGVLAMGILGVSPPILGGLIVLLTGSILMEMNGSSTRNRIKRYKRYLSLFHGRNSCSLEELSTYSGFSEKFLLKDLKKMTEIGMFPQGHIDQKKTTFMLNRERYEQYLAEQAELKERLMLEQQKAKELKSKGRKKGKVIDVIEAVPVVSPIEEGKAYIQQINDAKMAIVDTEVSKKVYRMEETIVRIIGYVEGHQEQLPEVRRFMQYYLPTTIKLLNAYHEFERQPIQGENITTAKNEIKDVLDTINLAFENLFDSLFQSASMDVSTDISVLHTMLAQEGLTEQDFTTS